MSTSEYAHPEALVNAAWIAELYENGWGVAQDYGKAHKCSKNLPPPATRLP
jgi:TPR repeat protein